jgi:phosphoribosyl 1,2-cyclic phosphate phosphodiesterase
MIIPKPLCQCRICREARLKGIPYSRTGPSAFLHDINLLIDTPAEITGQLNRTRIKKIDYLLFSHLDPDHIEGFRMVEHLSLDFRTWRAYPEKQVCLLLPEQLSKRLGKITSQYGSILDFYRESGFLRLELFSEKIKITGIDITAIPVDRGSQISFVYVFQKDGRRVVYAPCDIKPFPQHRDEVKNADILIIQPGIFEKGLKHGFRYPDDHISRKNLYNFEQTLQMASELGARKTVFIHLEEYWNRSYDDYLALEADYQGVRFAYDGMQLRI